MNAFEEVYDFRLAYMDETEKIMAYIGEDWKSGHIMSVNKELFEHEYKTFDNGRLNVMLAIRKDSGRIDGMLGFIPASQNMQKLDLWGSIWKIRKGSMMFLGNEIMRHFLENVKCRNYASIGINIKTTGRLVKKTIGAVVGRMRHWYILNHQKQYRIAVVNEKKEANHVSSNISVTRANDISDLDRFFDFNVLEDKVPYKDRWYINRRYFAYPINKYQVYMVGNKNKSDALLILRKVEVNGAHAIRIMDFIGNKGRIREIGDFLNSLLQIENYEYVDFYENGFSEEDIISAGFIERIEGDVNIIPNYFSPFVQENIDIFYHSPYGNFVFCKADGDQDRPN